MSEENLPEDVNVNDESGAELNAETEQSAVEATEDVLEQVETEPVVSQEDTQQEGSTEEATDEVADVKEEAEIEAVVESAEAESQEEVVESESEEVPTDEGVEAESDDTAKEKEVLAAEGAGVMAAAVAAATVTKEEAKSEPAPVKEAPVDDGKRWYSLRVISGKERKIKERIELEIQRNNWSGVVSQVLVPSEKVYKIRSGKKVILERNILPGYILVEAFFKKFSSEIVQGITNIPNVIHFLGKTKPIPMQQSEANRMLGKVDESQEVGEALIEPFIVGETVKITDGPFNGFVGDIKEVNDEKKKLKVIVKIFGRGTEVELNFMQVEKES